MLLFICANLIIFVCIIENWIYYKDLYLSLMKWIHTEGNEDVVYIYKKELIQLYIIDLKKRKKRLLFVININTFNTKKKWK